MILFLKITLREVLELLLLFMTTNYTTITDTLFMGSNLILRSLSNALF